jgi:ADP-L-glycero-D-manno-heptose 6-epimerase
MIIVTGGAGFIGSALVWKLNQQGRTDILVVDRMGQGAKWKNLSKRRFAGILHKDEFLPWLMGEGSRTHIEAIFHLGASSATTETDVDYLVKNNLNYSVKLWNFCADGGIPFIYASSAATYGDGTHGFSDDSALIPQLRALNPYGFSKQKFDDIVIRQEREPAFWAGLKFFNVYGPQEYHKGAQSSVLCQWIPQVKETGRVRLFKSYKPEYEHGGQLRDFVYIKDVVDVMWHLFQDGGRKAKSDIYNVGCGKARSFVDLARAMFQAMPGTHEDIEFIEMPEGLKSQYQYFTEASLDKLRHDAGYTQSFTSLEDGVKDYVTQYLLAEDKYL